MGTMMSLEKPSLMQKGKQLRQPKSQQSSKTIWMWNATQTLEIRMSQMLNSLTIPIVLVHFHHLHLPPLHHQRHPMPISNSNKQLLHLLRHNHKIQDLFHPPISIILPHLQFKLSSVIHHLCLHNTHLRQRCSNQDLRLNPLLDHSQIIH